MAIMDMFKGLVGATPPQAPANPNVPTGVADPGQPLPGTQQTPQTAVNGVVPEQTQTQAAASPLDAFNKIWETENTPSPDQNIFANFDPAKITEAAKKADFTKQLNQETLQQIQAGGPEAVQAMMQALQSVAQSVYANSTISNVKMMEQALAKQAAQYESRLPSMVKKLSANESLLAANPLLSNPAVQPLVGALQEQLVRKNPNATAAEIQQQVADYFSALGNTFGQKPADPSKTAKVPKSEDWESFFG